MSVKDRIKEFAKIKKINVSAFEKSIDASNGYVNSISKSFGLDKILKILEVYPEINLNWLLAGIGPMYVEDILLDPGSIEYEAGFKYYPTPGEVVIQNDDELEVFTNKNGNKFYIYGDGTIKIEVPMMSEPAYASYLEAYTDNPNTADKYLQELPSVTFKVDKLGKGKYFAFTTKNASMWNDGGYDTPSGAEVLGREIGRHLWSGGFHKNDYGFILLTATGIFHKDIKAYDDATGMLLLGSRNPDVKDFEMSINDVNQIFNVIKRSF